MRVTPPPADRREHPDWNSLRSNAARAAGDPPMAEVRTSPPPLDAECAAARHDWARVLVLGAGDVATRAFASATPVTFEELGLAPCVRLRADDATDRVAGRAGARGRTLLVTAADLRLPEIEWVLGYANRRCNTAVVSLARLCDPRDEVRTARRLVNVAAHELGHLRGLGHCRDASCVMRSAVAPVVLDGRGDVPCERCARILQRHGAPVARTLARRLGRWLTAGAAS